MAILTGKALYLEFGGLNLSGDYRTFSPEMSEAVIDASAGGDALCVLLLTVLNVEPRLTLLVDTGNAVIRAGLKLGSEGNLIWGPEGSGAGKPKWGIRARVIQAQTVFDYDGEQELQIVFANRQGTLLYDGRVESF